MFGLTLQWYNFICLKQQNRWFPNSTNVGKNFSQSKCNKSGNSKGVSTSGWSPRDEDTDSLQGSLIRTKSMWEKYNIIIKTIINTMYVRHCNQTGVLKIITSFTKKQRCFLLWPNGNVHVLAGFLSRTSTFLYTYRAPAVNPVMANCVLLAYIWSPAAWFCSLYCHFSPQPISCLVTARMQRAFG